MLRASVRNAPEASAAICWRMAGWASKSKSSRVLTAGNPAARIRSRAPEALRAEFRQPRPGPASDLLRDLADYDRAFGLITTDGQVA